MVKLLGSVDQTRLDPPQELLEKLTRDEKQQLKSYLDSVRQLSMPVEISPEVPVENSPLCC
jgi:hypothetical protein